MTQGARERVRMRPMLEHELELYLDASLEEYAAFVARNHAISLYAARDRAATSTAEMLPDGLRSPGHRFWVAEFEDGEHVGELWLGFRRIDDVDVVWVYDVRVDERLRGRGFGRQIMEAADGLAREMGGERLGLNVFGDNPIARGLYESLGYVEISRQMRKDIAP
jgi:ribosomal protein S18 acetylase RimI-like enzyme